MGLNGVRATTCLGRNELASVSEMQEGTQTHHKAVFPRAAESDVPLVVVACMARLRRPGGEKRYSKTCDENQPFGDHNPYVYRRVCSFKRFRKPALLCDQVQNFYSLILYVHALLLTAWPS